MHEQHLYQLLSQPPELRLQLPMMLPGHQSKLRQDGFPSHRDAHAATVGTALALCHEIDVVGPHTTASLANA